MPLQPSMGLVVGSVQRVRQWRHLERPRSESPHTCQPPDKKKLGPGTSVWLLEACGGRNEQNFANNACSNQK
eukprot:4077734-Pyramimonas_sp.AAC.1